MMKEHQEQQPVESQPHQDQQNQKRNHLKKKSDEQKGTVKINFYTDPLCCWSWALEQSWRRLLTEYGNDIQYKTVLCGMIRDWQSYNDAMNSVSKPFQMGPIWMHASEVTRVKMNYNIWHEDPPASSYPACIAVKTVELQSKVVAEDYFYRIRKAMMEEGKNIARTEVLFSIAEGMDHVDFDFNQFKKDWEMKSGHDLFRADIQIAKFHNIGRYPTFTFQKNGNGLIIVGYRPYEVLEQAFQKCATM